MPGQRAEPCNLNGICQSNNTCFCENDFATCAPLDTTNGCETNIGNDTNKCARPAAPRSVNRCWHPTSLFPLDIKNVWQRLTSDRNETTALFPFKCSSHAICVSQSWPSEGDKLPFQVSACGSLQCGAQLRVLRVPVPHRQRRVLQRRVRGPADQLHQLRPVRLLLRQPAQHPGVGNPTNSGPYCCPAYPHLQATSQPLSSQQVPGLAELRLQACCMPGRQGLHSCLSRAP